MSWPDLQDYGEKMTSVSMGGGVVLCLDFLFVYFSSLPIFQMSVLFFLPFESFFQLLCHRGGGGGIFFIMCVSALMSLLREAVANYAI